MIRKRRLHSLVVRSILAWVCAGAIAAGGVGCIRPSSPAHPEGRAQADEEQLYRCPAWAKVTVPEWVKLYVGRSGMPEPFHSQKDPIGKEVTGLDLWQANRFVTYRKETARYLYNDYTPLRVDYRPGSLPAYERMAAEVTKGLTNDRDKAVALVRSVPEKVLHPGIAPLGPACAKDRGLDDEALLRSGQAWCNEQARVFVRLCQVSGIPARIIFLFFSPPPGGHVIAEFYADGRWCMADASFGCVFPDAHGRLMSAAECHDAGKLPAGEAYHRRVQEMLQFSDEHLVGGKFPRGGDDARRAKQVAEAAEAFRKDLRSHTPQAAANQFWVFGVMNYPLPP
jgi:hypothetical protein